MTSPHIGDASTRLAPSLASQLHETARCVLAVERGRSLSEVLPKVAVGLRPGVQALSFQVLRHLGTARAVGQRLAQRMPSPPVLALLHTALAVLIADEKGERYQPHTLVNQAIEAAKGSRDTRLQTGFLNACLRRFLRERGTLLEGVTRDPVAQWNHPLWWIERLQRDEPDHWQDILRAGNRPGPMVIRVNRRRVDRDAYAQSLRDQGLDAGSLGEDGVVLTTPVPVERLPGFAQGHCSVQDGAAQLTAGLLLNGRAWAPGDRVLDACAAPGGKTAHVLERADVDLLALDVDAARCDRIRDNLQRLGLRAEVRAADAGRPETWWDGRAFEAILLDAPCTAAGIVRRHPDVRWLRRASDVDQLVAIQRHLLDALWPLLRPGGCLVYGTCSVFHAEGREQVDAFLERHTDAVLKPSPGHLRPGSVVPGGEFNDNQPGGYDGFYYARLEKVSL